MNQSLPSDARQWGMWCHLSSLAWIVVPIPYAGLLAPLLIWLLKRDLHPFVDEQGKESINFQLSMAIYATVAALLGGGLFVLFFLGLITTSSDSSSSPDLFFAWFGQFFFTFLILPALVILFETVLAIFAAIRASEGDVYRYPITLRFLK
ncbi:MAG: DUF4870 domain-containing protein [Leptolyngbyaceae cyanobacterium RU_5_1]|nr:DUF4870 domain-containing protein [Leptolyngbyaceae cyanobacterium RU_5_1]